MIKLLQVLKKSIVWLNARESALMAGEITEDEFLSSETAQALRLSLQSTLDMCSYLIENFNFKYLLTARVNQDNLEVLIRKSIFFISC